MRATGTIILAVSITLMFALQGALAGADELPEITPDGLHRIHDSQLAVVYAEPGVDLSGYRRVLLVDAQVAFRKNWKRDINLNKPYAIRDQDMKNIRARMSELFGEVFASELESGGYALTGEFAEDVLIVRPAIVDLDPSSPETASGRTRNITRSAGGMSLYLELRDSITGDLLVKALDYQYDRSDVTAYMQDRIRNERAAREILTNWAQTLVQGLDEARELTSMKGDAGS